MHIFDYIQFGILVCAIFGMIVSFLMLATVIPGARVGAESYDDPAFRAFVVSLVVLMLDVALWLCTTLWDLKIVPRPVLISICLIGVPALLWHVPGAKPWLATAWEKFRAKAGAQPLAPSKKPWLSKTIGLNAVVAAGLLAEANISSLQGLLPVAKYQIVAFVLPIVNMLLRAYTSQGVSFKPAMPQGEAIP